MTILGSPSHFVNESTVSDQPLVFKDAYFEDVQLRAPVVRLYDCTGRVTVKTKKLAVTGGFLQNLRFYVDELYLQDLFFEKAVGKAAEAVVERVHGYLFDLTGPVARISSSWIATGKSTGLELAVLDFSSIGEWYEEGTPANGPYVSACGLTIGNTNLPVVDAGTSLYGHRVNIFDAVAANGRPAEKVELITGADRTTFVMVGYTVVPLAEAYEQWREEPDVISAIERGREILSFRRSVRN